MGTRDLIADGQRVHALGDLLQADGRRVLRQRLRRERQPERQAQAAERAVVGLHPAAVLLDSGFDNRQTKLRDRYATPAEGSLPKAYEW